MEIDVRDCPDCPICGATELNEETGMLNIRAFKQRDENGVWWSECLRCKDQKDIIPEFTGWFCETHVSTLIEGRHFNLPLKEESNV